MPIGRKPSWAAFCAAWFALSSLGMAAPPDFEADVVPLLARYCRECHAGDAANAGLDLAAIATQADALRDRSLWEKVRLYVGSRTMPPPESPQPSDEERTRILAWIAEVGLHVDCSGPRDAGRVTLRRLNRAEYNNTVRDLLRVDFQPAGGFPADDVGYGFDNIGDVLSLPPILLEKYLAAAEAIVDEAVILPGPPSGQVVRLEAEDMRHTTGSRYEQGHVLTSEGEVSRRYTFREAGDYFLRVRAFGHQAGDEPARMTLRLDDEEVQTFDVTATEDSPQVFEVRLTLVEGRRRVAAAFLNDYYQPESDNREDRDRNLIVDYIEIEGPLRAPDEAATETHRRIFFREHGEGYDEEAARQILRRFASRAYRRPAEDEEVARLVELGRSEADAGMPFEEALKLPLAAVLVSPHFLFRVELDRQADAPDGSYALNDYELASRLSYFLWSSMPDDELFRLAHGGRLREPGMLEAQVRRMLADEKSRAFVDNFAGQWLQLRSLENVAPAAGTFPDFDEPLRAAMRRETEMYFAAIVAEDCSVLELLDADYTFVNERLARHYGLEGIAGEEFRRVSLPDDRRGGVLTQASVLTITSNPTRTSPVKRGKWILDNILGTPPPPPPAAVEPLVEGDQAALSGTLRQRTEQHREKQSCAVCHAQMDPLGFGLENFDGIGGWRTQDGAFAIDASGELPGGESFRGPAELREILRGRQDDFVRCLTEKMLTYSLGRGLEYYDQCTVRDIAAALAEDDYRFSRLVIAIAASEPFQRRRGQGSEP